MYILIKERLLLKFTIFIVLNKIFITTMNLWFGLALRSYIVQPTSDGENIFLVDYKHNEKILILKSKVKK